MLSLLLWCRCLALVLCHLLLHLQPYYSCFVACTLVPIDAHWCPSCSVLSCYVVATCILWDWGGRGIRIWHSIWNDSSCQLHKPPGFIVVKPWKIGKDCLKAIIDASKNLLSSFTGALGKQSKVASVDQTPVKRLTSRCHKYLLPLS